MSKIRVLLVDDSKVALTILKRLISSSPDMEVVGAASHAEEALSLIPQLDPNVICTDFRMPGMDGLAFIKEVMEKYPRPVLVISVSVQKGQTQNIFQLLEAGALDVFPKPRAGAEADFEKARDELVSKIRILSGVVVFRKRKIKPAPAACVLEARPGSVRMVCIGASTGGPMALHDILTALPENFPAPLVCVQHIGEGFLDGLVEWLASLTSLKVKIATPGGFPEKGTAYFPPEGRHITFDTAGRFVASQEPSFNGHRPSIDITFKSVAHHYGPSSIGILLTGMGADGAEGLLDIHRAGGITIAQDEATSLVFGMPKRAIERGAARCVLPLDRMAEALVRLTAGSGERPCEEINHMARSKES